MSHNLKRSPSASTGINIHGEPSNASAHASLESATSTLVPKTLAFISDLSLSPFYISDQT
jgi:hypothetical protein